MIPTHHNQFSFREFYERYSGIVFFLVSSQFKSISVVEDIVKAIFLDLKKSNGENISSDGAMRIILLKTRIAIQKNIKENNPACLQIKYDAAVPILLMCMQFGSVEELSVVSGRPVNELRRSLVQEITKLRV